MENHITTTVDEMTTTTCDNVMAILDLFAKGVFKCNRRLRSILPSELAKHAISEGAKFGHW